MVRVATFILITFWAFSSYALGICIENSYNIPPSKLVEEKLKSYIMKNGYYVSCYNYGAKVLLGTPAVEKELKSEDDRNYKIIYTFVLFPEALGLVKKKNFFGVRIFPLPINTYKRFLRKTHFKGGKVAVPVSKDMLSIAKIYLPKRHFKILVFRSSPLEVANKLKNYKVMYIFPDPKVLNVINLITLIKYAKEKNIKVISGLFDLDRFNLDYVDQIDYDKLAKYLILLIQGRENGKILPCPCR